jgi:YfiH family protein
LGLKQVLGTTQVHGIEVCTVTDAREPTDLVEADGLVVQQGGVGTSMLTADCLPVALGAAGAVAMLHAGWRGLAGGVIERGVGALHALGHEGGIAAAIGPCAGPCCYETGEEVHRAFGGAHRQGRHLDLRALARDRLLAAGVGDIQELETCTICDEAFFSYRREGERAGRQAGVAWLS